jgi:hypothetical protein
VLGTPQVGLMLKLQHDKDWCIPSCRMIFYAAPLLEALHIYHQQIQGFRPRLSCITLAGLAGSNAGTAEPASVSSPEAVIYIEEAGSFGYFVANL